MREKGSVRVKMAGILTFALLMFPGLNTAGVNQQQPVPLGPPYIIDSRCINSSALVDGFLNEPVWTAATTSVTKTTLIMTGWNLTIRTFFNAASLFIGVEMCGDTTSHPNDYCEICFDTDHDATPLPDAEDMKIQAKSTTSADSYSLWFGDGSDWVASSWPAGFAADGELSVNVTYEFQVPIEAAWGEASPPNGDIAGFAVHAMDKGDNEHVWWPDHYETANNPTVEYCDDPSGWGDVVKDRPRGLLTRSLYLFDDGSFSGSDPWDIMKDDLLTDPTLDDFDGDSFPGQRVDKGPPASDPFKYHVWNMTPASPVPVLIRGNITVTLWLANKDFDTTKTAELNLSFCDGTLLSPIPNAYTEIALAPPWPVGSFRQVNVTIPNINYSLAADNPLLFMLWVRPTSDDSVWIAYNTTIYPSRVDLQTREPYTIDTFYVNPGVMTIDGNLIEPAWTDPNVQVVTTNMTYNGWNLTLSVFHDVNYLFVGVVLEPDNTANPNDYCELAFDVNHNNATPLEATDLKIRGEGTTAGVDEYSVFNGSGVGWSQYSDETGAPNPWPTDYIADAEMQTYATYEFQVPISAVWGTATPMNGTICGFIVHTKGQAGNHVWWPDHDDTGNVPTIEYCDNVAYYGDLVFYQGTAPVADHLLLDSGDGQTGTVDTDLAQPIKVRAVTAAGISVPGTPVNFTIYLGSSNDAYFQGSGTEWLDAVTDGTGNASAVLHLGTHTGTYWVNASNPGLPGNTGPIFINTLDATAMAGPLATLQAKATPPTVAPSGASAVKVWANDSFGNGIAGLTVAMTFDSNPSTPGESVSSPAVDNGDGTYSASYTAGTTGGVTDVVRATSGAIWDTVSIDIDPDVPDHLVYVSGDGQSGTVDTAIAQPMKVRVVDTLGVNVPGIIVNYTVFNWPAGAAGYYFEESGQPWFGSVSDSQGIANATLHLGTKPGNYWVNASNSGLAGTTGPKFIDTLNATAAHGALAALSLKAYPGTVSPSGGSSLIAWANDSFGNGITGLTVAMSFDANLSGGSVSPTVSDNGDGTYSAGYTAGTTGAVTDVVNATSGGKWGTASIQVMAQTLNSIEISSNVTTLKVTEEAALTVWANDSGGWGIAGLSILLTFDANPSGASLTSVSDVGGGVYSATYTAGQTAWVMDTIRASCSGKEDTVNISVQAGVPSDLVYVSGDGQQKNISLVLDAPFVARAVDAYGNTVPGVPMAWAIDSYPAGATGQALAPASNATDASGLSGTRMTLGNMAGWFNASVTSTSVAGDSVVFSAEGLHQAVPVIQVYSIALIGGDGQTGSIFSKLANPFIVEVRNQTGAIASGVNAWFNVTAGGGHLDNSNVTTSATGRAQTFLTLGPSAGINTVSAEISSTGTSSVSFYAIGTAPEVSVALASNLTSLVTGGSMVFILTYDNTGTEPAKNVWLNFTMPANLNYISDSSGGTPTVSQNILAWLFPTSAVGPHSFVILCRLGSQASASFACHFDVNYSSQSGIRLPTVTSNTVTVYVLQEAGNNIPPIIDGVPDLIVHYDWDYGIDLAPYIFDPDNSESELSLILSDNVNARVNTTRNLAIVLNYSHDLLGISQLLNITVSDGLGSDWDVITITVSDDFPPEMVDSMPDVAFDEDMSCYGFNITHYFFDRDGDSLYYTYGQRHLNITILANYTVLFRGQQDWYGQERITFRALDPTGALIEDTILVTVRPVNDAPVTAAVPGQAGLVDISWVLDLSPYISDVDNAMAQLTLTVDSDYATINGLNITFRCAAPLNDILTITVSDGAAQAYIQISVLVEAPPVTPDSFPSWVLPPLIIILAIIALLMVLAARRKPVIEQAFLIYKDGALLAHTTNRMIPDMDSQIFSSMFTAIQDFIKDSFKDEKNWSLNKIEFGDNKIFVAKGSEGLFSLALVYKGRDKGLQNISKKAIEAIDKKFGKALKDWDGNMDHFRGVRDVLSDSIFK